MRAAPETLFLWPLFIRHLTSSSWRRPTRTDVRSSRSSSSRRSTPPLEWLNPIAVIFLIWLYGAGVLVMRETAVRWKTGWPSILVLGAAYGIIEEGLAVKSFFDPGWMDLGTLGWYGRWLDVNWVWAVWLTIYHAVVSIAIPIFLVEWLWPRTRGLPLTSPRGYIASIALLAS